MSRSARSLPLAALVVLWCAAAAPAAPPATDGPGALSHFDLARKDCVGTARNTTSKVWFTVANGVLSDVYFPTNDNTNVETLQYLVSDGSSFTDLQTRDTTYTVQATDDRALTCRVTTTAKSGRYKIVTDYTTDPSRPTVLIRSKFIALKGRLSDYHLYVRHDPTLNGNGGGGTGIGGHRRQRWAGQRRPGHSRRPYAARRQRPRDEDQRGQPRLRGARLLGARRQPRLRPDDQRLRRRGQRRPRAARLRRPRAHRPPRHRDARATSCRWGACRSATAGASRSRSATATPRPKSITASQGSLEARLQRCAPRLRARLERLRRQARQAQAAHGRLVVALERHPRRVLPQRQLREGRRGQDLPGRGRRLADLAVGPGDLGRRPEQHLLRLLPRGLRPRPLRGVDGGLPRRRPPHGDAT